MRKIILLKLGKIQKRIFENHGIELNFSDDLISEVARRCTEVESGARNVDNILTNTLLPEVSRELLGQMAAGVKVKSISAGLGEDGKFTYAFVNAEPDVADATAA
jgi:type VI secretion system protein VasG